MYFIAACANCKHWHRKCDRLLPSCTLCQQRNIPCEYKPPKKRKRPASDSEDDKEWETSIVQFATQTSPSEQNLITPQAISLMQTTPPFQPVPTVSRQIVIPETYFIDKGIIQLHLQQVKKIHHPSSAFSTMIQNSLNFLDQFGSFNTILALESSTPQHQYHSLSQQYKIHFALIQSLQAAAYIETSSLSNSISINQDDKPILEKHNTCFQNAFATVMSDPSIYVETSNNVVLAWIWASLAMSSMIDQSKYHNIAILVHNLKLFLEKHPAKIPLQRAKLFTTKQNTVSNVDEFVPMLQHIKTHLLLFSKSAVEEEFANYSVLDNIQDFKNVMELDAERCKELKEVVPTLLLCQQLLETIQMQFFEATVQQLEPLLVQTLLSFDNAVQTFLHIASNTEKLPDVGLIPMSFGIYEMKLKFVEEVMEALQEKLNHQQCIENLNKVKVTTANQMIQLLKWRDGKLLRKGQFNLKRCVIRIVNIHVLHHKEISLETLQWELQLMMAMQQFPYFSSNELEQTIAMLKKCIQEKEMTALQQSATLSSAPQMDVAQFQHSSFLELDEILNNFLV